MGPRARGVAEGECGEMGPGVSLRTTGNQDDKLQHREASCHCEALGGLSLAFSARLEGLIVARGLLSTSLLT